VSRRIHQNVDLAERGDGLRVQVLEGAALQNIRSDLQRTPPSLANLLRDFGDFAGPARAGHHIRSSIGQPEGNRAANARGSPDDQRDTPAQIKSVSHCLRRHSV
jgi:hypothetical protein